MDLLTLSIIGIGLAMDCFAVSVGSGSAMRHVRMKDAALIALFFGGFQAMMPVLGWMGAYNFGDYIESFDHWVAFAILSLIGVKMIAEALHGSAEERKNTLKPKVLVILAIATSIDALAVGVGFAFLGVDILAAAAVIGAFSFALSFAGVFAGRRFGHILEGRAELFGGAVLIAIGAKILLEGVAI